MQSFFHLKLLQNISFWYYILGSKVKQKYYSSYRPKHAEFVSKQYKGICFLNEVIDGNLVSELLALNIFKKGMKNVCF